MKMKKAILYVAARDDFLAFCELAFAEIHPGSIFKRNWHHQAIDWALEQSRFGKGHNLRVINLPPRHLKSELISVFYSAWILGREPDAKIISVSYGADLVAKLSRHVRKILSSDWYRAVFPDTKISPAKNTETYFETTAGGSRYATTINGELTGHGANYIFIDDPHNVSQTPSANSLLGDLQWFRGGLWSRFEGFDNGALIVLMQRYHPQDLTGYLVSDFVFEPLKLEAIAIEDRDVPTGPGQIYARKKGEALHPAYKSLEELEKSRKVLGEPAFQAQFQQDPTYGGGSIYSAGYFGTYNKLLPRYFYEYVILSVDAASTLTEDSSYTVGEVWGVLDNQIHLLRVFRDRREYPGILHAARQLIDFYVPSHVIIEDMSLGTALLHDLKKEHFGGIYSSKPKHSKLDVANSLMDIVASGRLHLPHSAPWLNAFKEELFAFPGGAHDDQVDAMNLILQVIRRNPKHIGSVRYDGKKPSGKAYPVGYAPNALKNVI